MAETSVHKGQSKKGIRKFMFPLFILAVLLSAITLTGCVTVPAQQQRLVSKSNMQFSGSAVFSYQDRLVTQFESGSASFTGGQSGDCGSCVAGGGQ